MNKGNALRALGQAAAAIAEYDAAIEIRARLVADGRAELEKHLAGARMGKGNALSVLGQAAAIAEYEAAIEILGRLVAHGRAELENDLAGARMNNGNTLSALRAAAAAIAEYDAAIEIRARLVADGRAELRPELARALANRAIAFLALRQSDKAALDRSAAQDLVAPPNTTACKASTPSRPGSHPLGNQKKASCSGSGAGSPDFSFQPRKP